MFGFRKDTTAGSKGLATVMVLLLLSSFLAFWRVARIYTLNQASFATKANLAEKIVWGVNENIAELIGITNQLHQVILSGGALLDYEQELRELIRIVTANTELQAYVPKEYQELYDLGRKVLRYEDELFWLLGHDRVNTYLIALMNTAESRPNGGFFGSYALVQVYKGKIVSYKVFDSYYAYYQNSGARLVLDEKYQTILGQQSINFISPNVYGFTDIDAGNIKILYEKLFPGQHIDGIIMLKSDLFEQLIPELKYKFIEWQFTNAAVDLIRGESLPNKKQQYLEDIGLYLENNKAQLIDQIIKNIPYMLKNNYIQAYFPNTSNEFKRFLVANGLNTDQNPDTLYARQLNKSFNKIDRFVTNKMVLQSLGGELLAESSSSVMSLQEQDIPSGEYDLYFFYTLSVPQAYADQIYGLTKQYDVELTQRETHILGLSYNRHNQIVVWLPERLRFVSLDGDYFRKQQSNSGSVSSYKGAKDVIISDMKYRQVVSFDVLSFGNDVLKVIRMRVKKI